MIRVTHLTLRTPLPSGLWRQHWHNLLRDLTFDCPPGEVTLLAGASGSGKTLLARAILDVLPQGVLMSGAVGRPSRLAYLPQAISHLDPTATIARQICRSRSGAQPDVPAHVLAHYPHQLSGGEARRVMLALLPPAEGVIADEPTAGLDPDNAARVMDALAKKARAGAAVLVMTHDLASALPYGHRVVLLHANTVAAIHHAHDFTHDGAALSPPARALWRALPQNGLHCD